MKKIFIYGAGYFGEEVYENVKNKYKVLGFIDSDKKKIKKKIKKKNIYSPSILKKTNFDKVLIASMWSEDIRKKLESSFKISKSKLHVFPISKIHKLSKKKRGWLIKSKKLIRLFNNNKISYYLDHSSLLGFKRKRDIYNFNDIDLAINYKQLKKIKNILKNSKFKKIEYGIIDIDKKFLGKKFNFQLTIDDIIDLQVKKRINNYYYWVIGSNILRSKTNLLDVYKTVTYKKIKINIPLKFKKYLSNLYGKNWIKPQKNWTYDDYCNIYSKIKFKNFRSKLLL